MQVDDQAGSPINADPDRYREGYLYWHRPDCRYRGDKLQEVPEDIATRSDALIFYKRATERVCPALRDLMSPKEVH